MNYGREEVLSEIRKVRPACIQLQLGRSFSSVVVHSPRDQEVKLLNPAGFFLL